MPAKRELTMRQLRYMLRLHHDGESAREIGRALGVARSTIQDNLRRAQASGIAWPLKVARPSSRAPWSNPHSCARHRRSPSPQFRALALSGRRPRACGKAVSAGGRKTCTQPDFMRRSKQRRYSITSSARASSVGGTSRSSAFAVLRLSTVSYLVGACTGRSAGFSPLRMRST